MARVRTIATIKSDIEKAETELEKRKQKVTEQEQILNGLLKEKRDYEEKVILTAIHESKRTTEELMEFLKG